MPSRPPLHQSGDRILTCLPAHGPYFLRLIRDMPHGARKKAQNQPARVFSNLPTTTHTQRRPTTDNTFLHGKLYSSSDNLIIYLTQSTGLAERDTEAAASRLHQTSFKFLYVDQLFCLPVQAEAV